jgi:hypothetical protein
LKQIIKQSPGEPAKLAEKEKVAAKATLTGEFQIF